jgi:ectoine hydroxylase-related dioxygenase (phytanoyl-CoA dioxygenase family)
MREQLRAEEVESYRANGFLVIEDFLSDDELSAWRSAVDDAVARGRRHVRSRELTDPDPARDSYYQGIFDQRANLWQSFPAVRELVVDSRIGRLVCDLEGLDAVRLYSDQALVKPAFGNPTSYHLDNPYHAFTSDHAANLWIALDDATVENGCLFYLPGTHLDRKHGTPEIGPEIGAVVSAYPEWAAIHPVACPVPAGGAVFHNALVAHGAGANMTARPRRAMTVSFMPDGSVYNGRPNILTPEQVAGLQVGDPIDFETHPVLYRYDRQPIPS